MAVSNPFGDPSVMALLGLSQGLLAAGAPSATPTGFGGALSKGIGGAMSGATQAQNAELQQAMLREHARLYGSEANKNDAAVARQAALAKIIGGDGGLQPAGLAPQSAATVGAPWAAAQPPSQTDVFAGKATQLAQGGFLQEANQMADLVKKMRPDLEFKDGVWYDKGTGSPVKGGAGVNPQGFGYQTNVDPSGQISLGVLPGAIPTFLAQARAGQQAQAERDLVTVPATAPNAPPTYRSRESLINGSGGAAPVAAGMSPAAAASQAADASQQADISRNFASTYNNLQNAAMSNPAKIQRYQRIGDLLEGFNGGKYSGTGLEIARAASSAGLKIDPKLPNKEAATALANEMSLELRNPAGGAGMPGALSDADREYLKSMTPGIAQTNEGRKQIIDARVKLMERESQVAMMARKYRQKYGKLDDSFFDQLQTWSGSNPIFKK